MKVFISWSGQRSKELANALRDWLPLVLQYIEPWVSDKDISAGERWAQAIAGELEAANFGIICITPENIHSEWILFEAGALSKSMQDAKVIPLLFGLELSDLSGPLSQFQAQKMEETGIKEIVKAINNISSSKTSDQIVDQLVPALWPRLSQVVSTIPITTPSDKHMRPNHEILEELVVGIRGIHSSIRELETVSKEPEYDRRKNRRMLTNSKILKESAFLSAQDGEGPLQLLMLAGAFRDEFPWIAELLTEAYREIRDQNSDSAERSLLRLMRLLTHMSSSKMLYELADDSKEILTILKHAKRIVEMALRKSDTAESHSFAIPDNLDTLW
jgi:hypothetical protein